MAVLAALRSRPLPLIAVLHAALFLWAAHAWIHGPFEGAGVVDGAEISELARTGSAGAFETKSPLYPWVLGATFGLFGDSPWTVAWLGLALSLSLLGVIAALGRACSSPRVGVVAALFYALSGSTLAFGVQPLETLFATLLLAGGAFLSLHQRSRGARVLGGVLLGAAPFARVDLALPVLTLLVHASLRRRAAAVGSALAAVLVLGIVFGARAIPEGGALNLRLGNDPARTGFTDLRQGPRYDRLRLEAVFEQPMDVPLESSAAWHLRLLGRAVADDPSGAAANLARKAYLFFHRTEIVASADFRHGLARFPLAPLLLSSFALVAPLALLGLMRRPPPVVLWPLLAILASNVLLVTSARYRFPALPFLCVAAALAVSRRPTRGELALLALLVTTLVPNFSGRRLVTPGDGLVQEGYMRLAAMPGDAAGLRVLERAVELGDDPRARYLLALGLEQAAAKDPATREAMLDAADRAYAAALELEPRYIEAAENRVALALRRGRSDEARARALERLGSVPYAGFLHLNLAELAPEGWPERIALALRGHELIALRAFAQGSPLAPRHAAEARRLGTTDARVLGLAAPAGERR